jgi:hypothetical protein
MFSERCSGWHFAAHKNKDMTPAIPKRRAFSKKNLTVWKDKKRGTEYKGKKGRTV